MTQTMSVTLPPNWRAEIVLDSVAPHGVRLTSVLVTYPRMVHAEFLRHRMLSRAVQSSRAIPTDRVLRLPTAFPVFFGKNRSGMQSTEEIDDPAAAAAWWEEGRLLMEAHAEKGKALGLHKEILNRPLEPYSFVTEIITATDWKNLFHLRCHRAAQREIQTIVGAIRACMDASTPTPVPVGGWHLPFIAEIDRAELKEMMRPLLRIVAGDGLVDDFVETGLASISAARCARASYLNFASERDLGSDIELAQKLTPGTGDPLHMSPFEHPAQALQFEFRTPETGNFRGWKQARKFIPDEAGPREDV